jgi:hypothetical protein
MLRSKARPRARHERQRSPAALQQRVNSIFSSDDRAAVYGDGSGVDFRIGPYLLRGPVDVPGLDRIVGWRRGRPGANPWRE